MAVKLGGSGDITATHVIWRFEKSLPDVPTPLIYKDVMFLFRSGGIATSDMKIAERARCAVDPCGFYWQGKNDSVRPFAGNGARASELMGAMLNAQLDRLDGMVEKMRSEKRRILAGTRHLSNLGLKATPLNSPEHECSTQVMYLLPNEEAAVRFTELQPSVISGKTGRHTYTQWDSVLSHEGAAHAAEPHVLRRWNAAGSSEWWRTFPLVKKGTAWRWRDRGRICHSDLGPSPLKRGPL